MSKITAVFDSEQIQNVLIQQEDENHLITSKHISFEDFKYILNDCQVKEPTYRIGRLPETFLDATCTDSSVALTGTFLFYVPASIQKMTYVSEKDTMMIPFPNLVFCFSCTNGIVYMKKVFATPEKKDRLNDNSPLYYYPYGNVSSQGDICYGSNSIPKMKSIFSFEYLIAIFLSSTTNNDLYENYFTKLEVSLEKLVRKLSTKSNTFDNSILKKNGMSIFNLM